MARILLLVFATMVAAGPPVFGLAQEGGPEKEDLTEKGAQAAASAAILSPEQVSRTSHTIQVDGKELAYTAVAGTILIDGESGTPPAEIFYVAYGNDDADKAQRPITFVFNGGPGAASAYLHLGALGPRRLVFNDDGSVAPAPARLVDNHMSWLAFTDLVFIDPVGTGYSRIEKKGKDEKEKGERDKGGDDKGGRPFWQVKKDLTSLSEFIRLYLSRNKRWPSPKFVAGESYGGFRAAALSQELTTDFGIGLNGIIMISPVLEFGLMQGDDYRVMPWVLLVPSYAAAAIDHGRSSLAGSGSEDMAKTLEQVEAFSLDSLLTTLAQGDAIDATTRKAVYEKLAGYIGLPLDVVERYHGRVPPWVFAKRVLGGQRLIGLYDASITAPDPDPDRPMVEGFDPTLDGITAPMTSAFNAYVRDELGFETDLRYQLLNQEISRDWDWQSGDEQKQGYRGAADHLKAAMILNPSLKALIAHGYFDLVTPYFASLYVVNHMALDDAMRRNLTFKIYECGHMIYTHAQAREQLYADVKTFYTSALPQQPAEGN
jgi:carboxypeptidase C (cathepsin A)